MSKNIKKLLAVFMASGMLMTMSIQAQDAKCNLQVTINGSEIKASNVNAIERKGKKLYPLKWFAQQMGAEVTWNKKENTAYVGYSLYNEEHLYLSYLAALLFEQEDKELAPLPERISELQLPKEYPLQSNTEKTLHEKPIGITITDNAFKMEFVTYDYEIENGILYVTRDWFNTIFLAQAQEDPCGITLTYPKQEEITQALTKVQAVLDPTTPEEAVNLWIRGQQVRSGALQYSSLSNELRKEVLAQNKGWVTGGSSPSAGKTQIVNKKKVSDKSYVYELSIEKVAQGKVIGEDTQQITVDQITEEGKNLWKITKASGDLEDFTVLAKDRP